MRARRARLARAAVASTALAWLACAAAAADLPAASPRAFKCEGTNGVPVYQDAPCAPGRALRDFEQDPATVSVVPLDVPAVAEPRSPPRRARGRSETADKPAPVRARVERHGKTRAGDPSERRHLREGMSEGEVVARVGPPDSVSKGGRQARWSYLPAPGDPQTLTMLRFDDGRLVDVERRVIR